MADINTVRVMNMPIAVDISTPALAMAKRRTMVYPIIRRNIPIALHDDSTSVRNAMKPGAQSQGVGLNAWLDAQYEACPQFEDRLMT
ncbi:hypothetical protein HA62_03370 [Pseudomonas putida]|nr:hypothetical protein HA62_03370 [Pseudomonas putida]